MIAITALGLANTGTLFGLDPFSRTGAPASSGLEAMLSLGRQPALAPTDPTLQEDAQLLAESMLGVTGLDFFT